MVYVKHQGIAIPKLHDTVIGRVTYVNRKTAHIEIVMVERRIAPEWIKIPIHGALKGVGDAVLAFVLGFSDNGFYLRTEHTHLGATGEILTVVSSDKVKCPATGVIETRKKAYLINKQSV